MTVKHKWSVSKALKMRMAGSSYREIAAAQNVSTTTVHQLLAPMLEKLADPETVAMYRGRQADILDGLTARTLVSITDEKLESASARDLGVLSGILIDKSRLVSGLSTSNHLVIHSKAVSSACDDWGDGHQIIDAEPVDNSPK